MRKRFPSRCDACKRAEVFQPGARCVDHETSTSPRIEPERRERYGAIGPVPVATFAYVVGEVPRFTEDGRRAD